MKEYDTPMFTAHRSIGKSSENLLGFASEVFFGFSILLLALNIGIYHTYFAEYPSVLFRCKSSVKVLKSIEEDNLTTKLHP